MTVVRRWMQESRAMVDCDMQRKIRSCLPQRACSRFCTLDMEIEEGQHLDVRRDRGWRLAHEASAWLRSAKHYNRLAKKDVCLSTPLAPHRDRGAYEAVRQHKIGTWMPKNLMSGPRPSWLCHTLLII
jgi:hypothetical protein